MQQGQNSLLLQTLLHVRKDHIIIIRTVRDREARRATSTFTQLLSSEYFCFYVSYNVQSGRQGRQTYRQVGYQADRQAGFQAGRQASRPACRQLDRQADRQTGRLAGKQAGRQTCRQAGRQAGRQANGQAGKQAGKQVCWQVGRLTDRHIGRKACSRPMLLYTVTAPSSLRCFAAYLYPLCC